MAFITLSRGDGTNLYKMNGNVASSGLIMDHQDAHLRQPFID